MNQLFIYIPHEVTNRERYTFNFVFEEYMGLDLTYVRELSQVPESVPVLYYCLDTIIDSCQFMPYGLLNSKEIVQQDLESIDFLGYKVVFKVKASALQWSFDPFSCIFYMISRYEEHLNAKVDEHGRFNYKESLGYQLNQLNRPWIEEILVDLKKMLMFKFPALSMKSNLFTFEPTYDIDAPYAFLGRSNWRPVLRGIQQTVVRKTNLKSWISTMLSVKNNRSIDPYDSYGFLREIDHKYGLVSKYFFLMNDRGRNNPSIDPNSVVLAGLIRNISESAVIGLHPSYNTTTQSDSLKIEHELLEQILGYPIDKSRQHFLRMKFPDTWNALVESGIRHDYSMGYAEVAGFRAGLSISFPAYDLVNDSAISLRIHPFCWMDATYRYYQNDSSDGTILEEAQALIESIKKVNGKFVTIFHNDNFTGWNKQRDFSKIYMSILAAIFQE